MTDLELFNENCAPGYRNTKSKVSWKVVDERLHLQGSVENEDWYRNFAIIPIPYRIRGVWCWISLGMLMAWLEIRKQVLAAGAQSAAAYSGGCPVAALWSAKTGLPAVAFGSPNFLWRPTLKAKALFSEVRFIDAPFDMVTVIPPGAVRGDRVYDLDQRHVEKPDWCPPMLWITGHSADEYRQRLA